MRLQESKIKEAILNSYPGIRYRATSYFTSSHSTDPAIMPLVIQAVEAFGRKDAFHLIGLSADLPQTESSIAWVIDELNNETCDKFENYAFNLSKILVAADSTLLLTRESDILEARYFLAELHAPFIERLGMLSWDQSTCWQNLEALCDEGKDKQYINEVDLGYGQRIIEALARYGQDCAPKVHELLTFKVDDYTHHPMKWLEPLVVRLAGQACLESTVPLLIAKLHVNADFVNEECAKALARIGTPAVLHAIAEAFPTAEDHFRIFANGPLENIHSDLAVETCLTLIANQYDEPVSLELAHALLCQFEYEGIEIARKMLVGRELDFESRGLRSYLLETCTLMGERFPEYEEWIRTGKAEEAEHWKRIAELGDDPEGLIRFALEKLTGKKATDLPKIKSPTPQSLPATQPPQLGSKQKVGRNEPCPCGSGKKFKNCCLRARLGRAGTDL